MKPKAPDNSEQQEALRAQKQEADDLKATADRETEERTARRQRATSGRQGLIATSSTGTSDTKTG